MSVGVEDIEPFSSSRNPCHNIGKLCQSPLVQSLHMCAPLQWRTFARIANCVKLRLSFLLCAHCAHFSFVAMCTFLLRCYVHTVQRYYYAHHCKTLGTGYSGYSGYWALQSTGYWILGKWALQSTASCWLFLLRGLRLFPTDCPWLALA